jgi:hypothetical protein
MEKRIQKERADAMYGKLLADQVHTKDRMEAEQMHPGDVLANSKGGTVRHHVSLYLTHDI